MPHNAFKKLPPCSGMRRDACLDLRSVAIAAAFGGRRAQSRAKADN
jgi:hypothetical protein